MSAAPFAFFPSLHQALVIPEAGILSLPLHQDSAGSILLFGFAEGQELSEHTAAVPATIQILKGRVELKLGSEEFIAEAGALAHMAAHLPHSVKALEPTLMLLSMNKAAKGL